MNIPNIHIDNFNYHLPQERIARYPLENRDLSNLLVYQQGKISHYQFFKLPEILPSTSALIFNNSKVICARLLFTKETGAVIEIFCLEPEEPSEYKQNLQNTRQVTWKCLIGNKKRWKTGILSMKINVRNKEICLNVAYKENKKEESLITFSWNDEDISFGEILDTAGKIPIPPYLMREAEESDKYRYQTVYSKIKGSVAAPTAGLHFTPRIFEQMEIKGIDYTQMTLHVGAGTFKPVQSDYVAGHLMHEETFFVTLNELYFIRKNLGHIIAVGTTSTRMLESVYIMGMNCIINKKEFNIIDQWDPYNQKYYPSSEEAIDALITFFIKNKIEQTLARTSIMILPGYQFKMVKGLVTNFHQPRSTLLLLIAALIGDDWKKVYQYAMENDFRFLSYGDGSLLIPKE